MNILLTGGAGYIGSHTAVVLSQAGYEVVLLDNFCNSNPSVLKRLQKILGKALPCVQGDIRDTTLITKTLQDYKIDSVIHFAGLKAVGESTENPIEYYANNVQGAISLLEAMKLTDIKTLVFSSSATVYGDAEYLPYDEHHPTKPINPYGQTKLYVEGILHDLSRSDSEWRIACLRYFNPVGAHSSGLIYENPIGVPNNLMPYIARVSSGQLPELNIYGDDYDTKDGTGERDYIHIMDLAEGHMAAIEFLKIKCGWYAINLGTGESHSVLEIVHKFEEVSGKKIARRVVGRRLGDLPVSCAEIGRAHKLLGWKAKRTLKDMCESVWRSQINTVP